MQNSPVDFDKILKLVPGFVFEYIEEANGQRFFPFASSAIRSIYGLDPEDVQTDATSCFDRIHPDDLPGVLHSIAASQTTLTEWSHVFRVHHPERGELSVHGRSVPERRPCGGTIWRGVVVDITAAKQVETDSRLAYAALNRAIDPIVWLNPANGRFLFANDATCRLLEITRDDLLTRSVGDFYKAHEGTGFDDHLRTLQQTGSLRFEAELTTANGRALSVEISTTYLHFECRDYIVATLRDLSERNAFEARLRREAESLKQSQQVGNLGTIIYDIASDQWAGSDFLDQIYGIDAAYPRTVTGWLALICPTQREDVRAYFQAFIERHEAVFDRVFKIIRPADGSARWVHGRAEIRVDETGRPVDMIGTIQDVTADVEQKEALRSARDRAETANRTKTEFLANVSHELRTPLNAIIGFAEMMDSAVLGPVTPVPYQSYVRDIRRAGEDLLQLVSDVIDISLIDAGNVSLEEDWCALPSLLEETVRLLQFKTRAKKIDVSTDVPGHGVSLYVDRRRIRQVLINLMDNATKFTPRGGHIAVRARRETDGAVSICVQDTGVGISADQIDAVLNEFVRGSDAYVREQEGSGLGLPICIRIMDLHGGSLSITGAPGAGTCVTVRLPADRVAADRVA